MDKPVIRALSARGYDVNPAESLGKGSFAEVYKGTRLSDGLVVAIKQIHKNRVGESSNRKLLESEIRIMTELYHDNIVALIDTIWEEDHICLVMEYCNGGDLGRYIAKHAPLSENVVAYFGQQIAAALAYLHSQRIVHRDLKPQNILLHYPRGSSSRPVLRIADFGFARHLSINMADTFCGSPLYMAPEVLFSRGHDESSDLWGAGAILYQCLTTKPPFKAKSIEALKAMLGGDRPLKIRFPVNASPAFRDLITGLLEVDPAHRMTCAEFVAHPFLAMRDEALPSPVELGSMGSPVGRSSPVAARGGGGGGARYDRRDGHGDADLGPGTGAHAAFGGGIPYGDAPATPSPHNSSDSNPSLVHISSGTFRTTGMEGGGVAGAGGGHVSRGGGGSDGSDGSGGGGSGGQSFVVVDKDTVELNVLADKLQHHRREASMWTDHGGRRFPSVPDVEIDQFESTVREGIVPASAIMLAAKRHMDWIRTHSSVHTNPDEAAATVESLQLLNEALHLLRAIMSKVRAYLQHHNDAILYTERGGGIVQQLRDTFNNCLGEVEAVRRLLPSEHEHLLHFRGIEVKSTEELLYEYATDLSRSAADLEAAGDLHEAEVIYSRVLVLLDCLLKNAAEYEDERVHEDKQVLQDFVESTRRRLEFVRTAPTTVRMEHSRGGGFDAHAAAEMDAGQWGRGAPLQGVSDTWATDPRHVGAPAEHHSHHGGHAVGGYGEVPHGPGSYPPSRADNRQQQSWGEYAPAGMRRHPRTDSHRSPRKASYTSPLAQGAYHPERDDRRGGIAPPSSWEVRAGDEVTTPVSRGIPTPHDDEWSPARVPGPRYGAGGTPADGIAYHGSPDRALHTAVSPNVVHGQSLPPKTYPSYPDDARQGMADDGAAYDVRRSATYPSAYGNPHHDEASLSGGRQPYADEQYLSHEADYGVRSRGPVSTHVEAHPYGADASPARAAMLPRGSGGSSDGLGEQRRGMADRGRASLSPPVQQNDRRESAPSGFGHGAPSSFDGDRYEANSAVQQGAYQSGTSAHLRRSVSLDTDRNTAYDSRSQRATDLPTDGRPSHLQQSYRSEPPMSLEGSGAGHPHGEYMRDADDNERSRSSEQRRGGGYGYGSVPPDRMAGADASLTRSTPQGDAARAMTQQSAGPQADTRGGVRNAPPPFWVPPVLGATVPQSRDGADGAMGPPARVTDSVGYGEHMMGSGGDRRGVDSSTGAAAAVVKSSSPEHAAPVSAEQYQAALRELEILRMQVQQQSTQP